MGNGTLGSLISCSQLEQSVKIRFSDGSWAFFVTFFHFFIMEAMG